MVNIEPQRTQSYTEGKNKILCVILRPLWFILLLALLSELAYLSLYYLPFSLNIKYIVTALFCFVLYIAAILFIRRNPAAISKQTLGIILLSGALFRLTLIALPPFTSDDIYRYVWDGRVQAAGINPFSYAPTADELAHLRDNSIYPFINHSDLPTIYPPLAQLFFFLTYITGKGSLLGYKLLVFIAEMISCLLLARLLGKSGQGKSAMAIVYAWCPLPILEFSIAGHVDALGIPFLILFFDRLLSEKTRQSAFALAGAVLVKVLPVIFLPIVIFKLGLKRAIEFGAIFVLALLAGYLPYLSTGPRVFGSLGTYVQHWSFNSSIFSLLNSATGSYQTARIICFIAIAIWTVGIAFKERDLKRGLFWTLAGVYLFFPTVYPWYLTWIVPLLAFVYSRAFLLLLMLVPLSYLIEGDSPLIRALEYLPFFAMLGYDLITTKTQRF